MIDIDVAGWAGTKRSLHRYAQMLGKMRVALSPPQPNWMFTALHLSAQGMTTGLMPCSAGAVEAILDVFTSEIVVRHSDGRHRQIELLDQTVAGVYGALRSALADLDIACSITPIPQEVADATPFDEDTGRAAYEPDAVQRWFAVSVEVAGIFDRWRSHFFGRSGIQLWWGAFDLSLMLFNGRHVTPPADRGYLLKYDLDAELMNVGLYYGDEQTPPFFYGYLYPQPSGAEGLAISPAAATWSDAYKEWVLPYDAVRSDADPAAMIYAFLDSVYAHAVKEAGWDRTELSYVSPKPVRRADSA
jgi:hypothetical protein